MRDVGGTGLKVRRWLSMTSAGQWIRQSLSTRNAKPPVIAATAFAIGLVIGCCVFLIPFAISSRGGDGNVKQLAAVSAEPSPTSAPGGTENTAISEAAAAQTTVAQDGDAALCDRQAWPYVTPECRQQVSGGASGNRQVRVVTTDANAPSVIASPVPVISPPAKRPQPVQQATQSPPDDAQNTASQATLPRWAQNQPRGQVAPAVTSEQRPPTEASPVVAAASAADSPPAPAANERKSRRETREARKARMMVRTIEFADGRTVTITHPIGKGGTAVAAAALDRASADARAQQEPGNRRYVAESDDDRDGNARRRASAPEVRGSRERAWYEPDPEPAMAQADDEDLASSRTTRRRYR